MHDPLATVTFSPHTPERTIPAVTTTLDAPTVAPSPTATTDPTVSAATEVSEAVVICSALALAGNPMAGLDLDPGYATRIVATVRASRTITEILSWHAETEPATWDLRWWWGRRVTVRHFPNTPGVGDLPLNHVDAPRANTRTY